MTRQGERADVEESPLDPRRPHTLYVAWGFAPHRGPGVYRPLATVNELVHRGHRVTVLTADLYTFDLIIGGDRALLDDIDPSVRVVRVPMPPQQRDPLLNRWTSERVTDPQKWGQALLIAQTRAFPELVYATWQRRAEAVACRLHEQDPVDLVVATGNPYVDYTVPIRLHEDYGIPYVLDDRDSWLVDVYTGELNADAERIEPWLELALAGAVRMWFVNPGLADWHRSRFPKYAERIRVVENGWDPRFLDIDSLARPKSGDDRLIYSYVGAINSSVPLRLLAEGWRLARQRSDVLARSEFRLVGQIGHSGVVRPHQAEIMNEFAGDAVVFTGRQSKHLVGHAYASSDVLVFAKEGGRLVTSGKVYEYVASGLPIVSALDPAHDARRVLAGYPRWHDAAEPTAESLADAYVAAVADAANGSARRSAALAHGARFRRDVVLADAFDELETAIGA